MDKERLFSDIKSHLWDDPISAACLDNQSDPKWTVTPDGLLRYSNQIYVPDYGNLWLCVLQYLHNHPLAGHFSQTQTKTLHTVWMQYAWPGLPVYIKNYCRLCTTCSHAKAVRHWPYGLLKQLPVPEKPVTSRALGYPTHRLGLVVLESRGVWTEASACALCRPSVAVQVFRVECRYMRSPKIVGKSQSRWYHRNNLPGMHKSRVRQIEGQAASVVWKKSSSVEDLSLARVGERQ